MPRKTRKGETTTKLSSLKKKRNKRKIMYRMSQSKTNKLTRRKGNALTKMRKCASDKSKH